MAVEGHQRKARTTIAGTPIATAASISTPATAPRRNAKTTAPTRLAAERIARRPADGMKTSSTANTTPNANSNTGQTQGSMSRSILRPRNGTETVPYTSHSSLIPGGAASLDPPYGSAGASPSRSSYAPLPTPHSLRPTPYAPRPTPYAPRPTPYALLPTPHAPLPTPRALRFLHTFGGADQHAIALDLAHHDRGLRGMNSPEVITSTRWFSKRALPPGVSGVVLVPVLPTRSRDRRAFRGG